MEYFCEICILGVHIRRKLFNIGEGKGVASPARSTSMLGGGGRVYSKTYIHARMHTYIQIYTHVDASVKFKQS